MKQFWQEFCIQVYMHRAKLWALMVVIALWIVLSEWVIPRNWLDVIVYCAFGWFVLGDRCIPWAEQQIRKLID